MKSSIHSVARVRPRFNNNKKFKGLTNTPSKNSLVLLKIKPSLKFCVQKSIIANFTDSSNMGLSFSRANFTCQKPVLAPFHLVNGPFPSGKCSTMKLERLKNNGNLWTYVYCGWNGEMCQWCLVWITDLKTSVNSCRPVKLELLYYSWCNFLPPDRSNANYLK